MQPTQKEAALLKELKGQEQLCIQKYNKYSSLAIDGQLKNLFTQIGCAEQQHLDTLTQLEQGTIPQPAGGSKQQPSFTKSYTTETQDKKDDCYLCRDLLAEEKAVSHLYDTSVFEFTQEAARTVLNHIQSEEQGHGKMIYDYMATNGMYN